MTNSQLRSITLLCVFIFLLYGALVNSRDLESYTLQHAVAEALVERRSFSVLGSPTGQFRTVGDTFVYRGWRLPAKQPGQFVVSAAWYKLLHSFGLDYANSYHRTAALVSWLTTGSCVTLAALLSYLLLRCWKISHRSSLWSAAGLALATPMLAYAGVPHHDILASSLLIAALFFITKATPPQAPHRDGYAIAAGFAIALVPFFSMLAFPIACCLGAMAIVQCRGARVLVLSSIVIGGVPLFAYNTYYFGNPLVQANIAGGFSDTFFNWNAKRFLHHLNNYIGTGQISIFKYAPLVIWGACGLLTTSAITRTTKLFFGAATISLLAYVLNIETIGHCQYGPRYLLPLMPLLLLGIGPLLDQLQARPRLQLLRWAIFGTAVYSLIVTTTGALFGSMYCELSRFAPRVYWENVAQFKSIHFPLSSVTLLLLGVLLLYWIRVIFAHTTASTAHTPTTVGSELRPYWVALLTIVAGVVYYFSTTEQSSPFNYTYLIAKSLLQGEFGVTGRHPGSWLSEFVPINGVYYSVFPLGSVLSMLPVAILSELQVVGYYPSRWIIAALGSLGALFSIQLAQQFKLGRLRTLVLATFITFGTWHWANLSFGGAWQIALGVAMVAQLALLWWILSGRGAIGAGIFFSFAFGNRTELLLTAPLIMYLIVSRRERWLGEKTYILRESFRFSAAPLVLGIATLFYNYARFGSPFDFGYARIPGVLDEPWYQAGIFSWSAIDQNLEQMLLVPWKQIREFPYLTPTGFGGSIFLASPLLFTLCIPGAFARRYTTVAWLAVAVITTVLWCHGNPGGWQYSYRYAAVLIPWCYLILLSNAPNRPVYLENILVLLSVAISSYAVYLFSLAKLIPL